MDVCYKLKVTGAFHVLPFQVRVIPNTITMHNVEDAEDLFYVNNAMSSFIVRGPAVGREDEALRVLSAHATSCEDMSQLLAEVPAVRQAEQYAKVTFQVNSETSELKVCYKFGALGFRLMSVAIPVLKVTSVFKGDAVLNAVYVDSTNTFEAEGFNLQTGDKMKFVDRMGQAEYSCLSSGDALHGQPEVTLTLNDKGRTEGAFRFTEPGLNLAMCYYFAAHNKHVLFPAIQVDVLEVKYESEDVAIMGYPYSMEFTGAGQSAGDRVMWMKGDAVACDPMSDAVVSSVEILNEYKKVTFVFGSVYRGLKLCVKKAIDEDWTLLTQYSLDVLGVTAMSVPAFEEWEEESRSRVLANLDAEIFFNDHDEGDKAKFVSADRACESDMGVCGLMTVGEAHNATLNCRPAEEVVLCYYFARAQQWVKYENKKLRVAGPSGVTLEKEVIGDDLVAHMTVSGVDVASDCAHVEVTKDEAFLRALEVSSNDATLTRSDIMAALGNTQYGLSSESGHPLELTFTAPTAFSIAAIWIHAAKQDISPRTVEVYRKEEGAMVLAFRYTTTYAANQAEMSPMSDFNGVSTTWTISIVDTLLAEREEANETLEPFTYFTGLDIISSSGAERSDVDVKFVAAEEDCSAASAMLDHRTGAVMEVARMNACTGVLAPFTVADYSKTYKMCYAQRSAPDGYSEYVAYDELSFAFRYTTVSAAGAATFAMAGVDKALSLTASTGEAITKVLFVPYAGACEVSFASSGPFMVENGEVTVRFTKDQDAMRLCVMYGDEEVYEPQRFVMSVGYIEVVAYAAAWTVYEPYVLTVEGRYLNANNRVVDSKQKVEPTAVVDGVATLHFTAGVLEDALLYTVTELNATIALKAGARAVVVDVYSFGQLARSHFLTGMQYNAVEIIGAVGVTASQAYLCVEEECVARSIFAEAEKLYLNLGSMEAAVYTVHYIFPAVRSTMINTQVTVTVELPGAITLTPANAFVVGSDIVVEGPGLDVGDVILMSETASGAAPFESMVQRQGEVLFFSTAGFEFTKETMFFFCKYYTDGVEVEPTFIAEMRVLLATVEMESTSLVTEYPYKLAVAGINLKPEDSLFLGHTCAFEFALETFSQTEGVFRVPIASTYPEVLLCYHFAEFGMDAELKTLRVEAIDIHTEQSQYFAVRNEAFTVVTQGNYPHTFENRMRLFLSSSATCATETVLPVYASVDTFVFTIADYHFSELYVCVVWDAQAAARLVEGTSVVVKDLQGIAMSVGIVGQKQTVKVTGQGLNSGDKVLFAKGFCSSSVRNGPFTVKSFEEGLFFEAEWTTASTSKMVLCYEFLGSNKYYLLSGFERYIIATEAVVPMVVRAAEAETVRIATSKVPENSVIAVAESCGAEEKRAMTLKESATAFVFDYEEATAGERAVCLSTDGEHFVELGKVTAVTLEGLSVDRWVTGLPIAASLVGEIAVSGSFVEGSSLKFVRASCDEAVPEVPIVDGKLDVEVPFTESGVFKTCLVSPGASHAYLFSAVEVTVSELEVSTTPAVVNQLINTKHVVELSVHLSAENMTTVVVFVSADDCATELVEAVEITESATVQFAFATGFDSALTVCSRFASEAAKATGTTLNLYSVFFDPSVWTPFFDIPFQVTGVSIKTPFDQDVLVNWIPLEESCENVNEGENLKGLKSTVFRKNVLRQPVRDDPDEPASGEHVRPDRPDDDACACDREQPLHRAHRVGHAPPDRDDRVEARER